MRTTVTAQQIKRVFVGSEAVGPICCESGTPAVEDRRNRTVTHCGSSIGLNVGAGAVQLRCESVHEVCFSITGVSCEDEAEALAHFGDEKVFEGRLDMQTREVRIVQLVGADRFAGARNAAPKLDLCGQSERCRGCAPSFDRLWGNDFSFGIIEHRKDLAQSPRGSLLKSFEGGRVVEALGEPPLAPELGDARGSIAVFFGMLDVARQSVRFPQKKIACLGAEPDAVYAARLMVLKHRVGIEAEELQTGAKLAKLRAAAFAEDAVHVAEALLLFEDTLDSAHRFVGEMDRAEAAGVADHFEADLVLLRRDNAAGEPEPVVLAGAVGVERGRAEEDQAAVFAHGRVLDQRADN